MKIAIIGRNEILFETAKNLHAQGHNITCILTAKEAPEYKRKSKDFQALALKWNIPFAQGARIGRQIKFLQKQPADIAVSINYPGILPQPVINLFPYGVLNAHGGDLPRYRGNACQAWAILNGEKKIGLCIHKMIGGELDSGDIIARDYFPIDHNTKIGEIWAWMRRQIPNLMLRAIEKLSRDPHFILERQSRKVEEALRCYPRKPEDGRIEWKKSALDVLRLVNASNKPYAGAFCEFEGHRLIIWDAELVKSQEKICAVPGQITKIERGFVEVACGSGILRIKEFEKASTEKHQSSLNFSLRKRFH